MCTQLFFRLKKYLHTNTNTYCLLIILAQNLFFFLKKKLTETMLVIIQKRDSVCKFSKEHLITGTVLALGNPRVKR